MAFSPPDTTISEQNSWFDAFEISYHTKRIFFENTTLQVALGNLTTQVADYESQLKKRQQQPDRIAQLKANLEKTIQVIERSSEGFSKSLGYIEAILNRQTGSSNERLITILKQNDSSFSEHDITSLREKFKKVQNELQQIKERLKQADNPLQETHQHLTHGNIALQPHSSEVSTLQDQLKPANGQPEDRQDGPNHVKGGDSSAVTPVTSAQADTDGSRHSDALVTAAHKDPEGLADEDKQAALQSALVDEPETDAPPTEHKHYRACAAALGLAENADLPDNIKAFVTPTSPSDEFVPQRIQAVQQEMAHLRANGLSVQQALDQINAALNPTTTELTSATAQSRRRIKLHEAVLIKKTPLPHPLADTAQIDAAVKQAFAAATGLNETDLTAANLGLVNGTPAAQSECIATICATAAEIILADDRAVPQFDQAGALGSDPAIIAAQSRLTGYHSLLYAPPETMGHADETMLPDSGPSDAQSENVAPTVRHRQPRAAARRKRPWTIAGMDLSTQTAQATQTDTATPPRAPQTLHQAVEAAKIPLETLAADLTPADLKLICTQLPPDDNIRRAFINILTVGDPDLLTVDQLLRAASAPVGALADKSPLPWGEEARTRRTKALTAVVTAQMGDEVSLDQMTQLEQRVATLVELPSRVAPALYAPFAHHPNKSQPVADIIDVLKHDLSSAELEDAVRAGHPLRELAIIGQDEPIGESVLRVLAIEAVQLAAARAPTPQQAMRNMLTELYRYDAIFHDKAFDLDSARKFADACMGYMQGKRRRMPSLAGPFADLCTGMLTVAADKQVGEKLKDPKRLDYMLSCLRDETLYIETALGAKKIRQLQLRNALWQAQRTLSHCGQDVDVGAFFKQVLFSLHQRNVLRPEDVNAMWQQFDDCHGDKTAVQTFIDSTVKYGWDFTAARPNGPEIGFAPTNTARPTRVASLAGKAQAAAEAIRVGSGDKSLWVRVVRAPNLIQADKDTNTIKKGEFIEKGSDEAVIQVGLCTSSLSDGKVTLRSNGSVATHDVNMIRPMVQTLLAAHPTGGDFTPTTALMANKALLQDALQTLAQSSKGAKWQISLSSQAQANLSPQLKQQLENAGITFKSATVSSRNGTAPANNKTTPTPSPTSLPFAKQAANGPNAGAAPNNGPAAAPA
jgi:hypothetical protein